MFKNMFRKTIIKNVSSNPKKTNNRFKTMARLNWKISQVESNQTYGNLYSSDKFSFTENVVDSAKEFVKKQENSNPNWNEWVSSWENETK